MSMSWRSFWGNRRKSVLIATAGLALATAVGCGLASEGEPAIDEGKADQHPTMMEQVQANNTFALKLYQSKDFNKSGENFIYSPYSISSALAMTYAGALNNTDTQMKEAMGFLGQYDPANRRRGRTHDAFRMITEGLLTRAEASQYCQEGESCEGKVEFKIANAAFRQQGFPVHLSYMHELTECYSIDANDPAFVKDFENDPEQSRRDINTWVKDQCTIEDLLPKRTITDATKMVLANALFMKGAWQTAFKPEDTDSKDDNFTLKDGTKTTVEMMHGQVEGQYIHGDGYQAMSIPLRGKSFTMLAVVPEQGTFDDFEAALDSNTLAGIVEQLHNGDNRRSVTLDLPKFSFNSAPEVVKTLKSFNMTDAFDEGTADFTRMYDKDAAGFNIYISDIKHKAKIIVDEKGLEAAAATAVIMSRELAVMLPLPAAMSIDRPFIFVIRDKVSQTILFIGRVLNPGMTANTAS